MSEGRIQGEVVAGCELDAVVAEKVMGVAYARHDRVWINDREVVAGTWLPANADPRNPPPGSWAGMSPPRFSSEIAVAWLVATKLHANGWEVNVCMDPGHQPDVQLFNVEVEPGFVHRCAPTVPLAICLGALDAAAQQTPSPESALPVQVPATVSEAPE